MSFTSLLWFVLGLLADRSNDDLMGMLLVFERLDALRRKAQISTIYGHASFVQNT